jgi:hypothetical protein
MSGKHLKNEKPWKGVLIPTFKEHHASLIEEIPELKSHSI